MPYEFQRRLWAEAAKYQKNENAYDPDRDGWEGAPLAEASQTKVGKITFTKFTEGSLSGWTISVMGKGEIGFIEEPSKRNTKVTSSPHKVFLNTQSQGEPKMVLSAWQGTENRQVSSNEIRYAPRNLLKAVAEWFERNMKDIVS